MQWTSPLPWQGRVASNSCKSMNDKVGLACGERLYRDSLTLLLPSLICMGCR